MKTKLYFLIFMLLIIITCGYNFKTNIRPLENFHLLNLEALATGETGGSCWGSGSVDCPLNSAKVYFVITR